MSRRSRRRDRRTLGDAEAVAREHGGFVAFRRVDDERFEAEVSTLTWGVEDERLLTLTIGGRLWIVLRDELEAALGGELS